MDKKFDCMLLQIFWSVSLIYLAFAEEEAGNDKLIPKDSLRFQKLGADLNLNRNVGYRLKRKSDVQIEWEKNPSEKNPLGVWEESEYVKDTEKDSKIAQVFMRVAYGEGLMKKAKPFFINDQSTREGYEDNDVFFTSNKNLQMDDSVVRNARLIDDFIRKPTEIILFRAPKRVQKSLDPFYDRAKSLVREMVPSQKVQFSLPQLISSPENENMKLKEEDGKEEDGKEENKKDNLGSDKENGPKNAGNASYYKLEIDFKDDTKYGNLSANKRNGDNDNESTSPSEVYLHHDGFNWSYISSNYSPSWKYQDYVLIASFSLASLFPLFVIFHLKVLTRDHLTPGYCLLLMIQLLIVCVSRIILYTVDPFGLYERFPQFIISTFNILAQSLLICSTGLFFVILLFPVYRPKSVMLPRMLALFFILLFCSKLATFLFFSFRGNYRFLKLIKAFLVIADFCEVALLVMAYIFLNLFTRQRHKIWWIRIYRKNMNSSNNNNLINVSFSFLKKSIGFGSGAALLLLINAFFVVCSNFDWKLHFYIYSEPLFDWVLETTKCVLESVACCFLAVGSCYLFVPLERLVFEKRSYFKGFLDAIKGRRRSSSQLSLNRMRQTSSIFTLNRNKKGSDNASNDFQLVWNQTLPLAAMASTDNYRKKYCKSLDLEETAIGIHRPTKAMTLSRSVDILNGVYAPKDRRSCNSTYDNLEDPQTPIYQNEYFHYNYRPKLYDGSATVHGVWKSNGSLANAGNKRKSKRKPRPKSYIEDRPPRPNENYLTSYFSVLSMDKFLEGDPLVNSDSKNFRSRAGNGSECTTTLTFSRDGGTSFPRPFSPDETNARLISNEKWKNIKITPKSCTINLKKKNLPSSKSLDFF